MSININERESYPSNWARSCDLCHTAPCTLYCHTDSTYLCQNCDECIHLANPSSLQHERFWICTACESSPATITCQADAANLCISCDTEIHLANPLARRHVRVPITPPPRVVPGSSNTSFSKLQGPPADKEIQSTAHKSAEELEEDEADSWLLLDLDNEENLTTSGFTCCGEVDEYLDLIEFDSCVKYECQEQNDQEQFSSVHQGDNGSDSVVPVQSFESKNQYEQQQNTFVDSGYETSKSAFINSTSSSRKVPYMNPGYYLSPSNIPNSYSRFPDRTARLLPSSSILMPLQFSLADREEKVLRYREKRKSRKFEKKIRYATRKTNAESRPRVKGRFARKKGTEFEVNQTFPAEDCGYGVVPSYEVK